MNQNLKGMYPSSREIHAEENQGCFESKGVLNKVSTSVFFHTLRMIIHGFIYFLEGELCKIFTDIHTLCQISIQISLNLL